MRYEMDPLELAIRVATFRDTHLAPTRYREMFVVAVLLSVVLFVSFASAGAQKIVFNPATSKAAEHFGFTKRGYQRIGLVELLGAVAVIAGLAASRGSALGVLNEI